MNREDSQYITGKGFQTSIVSYPQRGHWGRADYPGNTSGYLIYDFISQYYPVAPPNLFVELFSGGGTGRDVAREMGIVTSVHLDINNGWDALNDEVPQGADLVFAHPPYWNMIDYAKFRGKKYVHDISSIGDYDAYVSVMSSLFTRVYESIAAGGRYGVLLGLIRRRGKLYDPARDIQFHGTLVDEVIKVQHNTSSGRQDLSGKYGNSRFTRIVHEKLLIYQKQGYIERSG
ncbi:hypothetical protein [Lacticaseibacillus nasuensis]|uniref:hypothetical protein n=2 Tax=Lacticaseibacillus nasuensis TaxID=944671 RepID=UPI000704A500|nr:hypothetical protein [Lacticaseibacillus nasuensis]